MVFIKILEDLCSKLIFMRKVTTLLIQGLPEMQKSLMCQPLSWEAGYRKVLVGIGEEGGVL